MCGKFNYEEGIDSVILRHSVGVVEVTSDSRNWVFFFFLKIIILYNVMLVSAIQ